MASMVPEFGPAEGELYFVLCDFKRGAAFVETDPAAAARADIIDNLIVGEYDQPLRVIAVDLARGSARDVSEEIATEVAALAAAEVQRLPPGTRDFVAAQRVSA
jgi:hypothetical protein